MPSPPSHLRALWFLMCAATACGLVLFGMVLLSGTAFAQAPGQAAPGQAAQAPAQAAPGDWFWRIGFLTLDQWAYKTHPYAQITGNSNFDNGHAVLGGSFLIGAPESDSNSFVLVQILHSLPPFSVEYGRGLDLFLPKGITFGFDYYYFGQQDTGAATGGTVPPIKTDTYLYQAAVRAFAFDPGKAGLNYYIGVGLGTLQGKMTSQPFSNQSPEVISYSQPVTGSTILGVEAKGESIGLRYELNLISASQVKLDKNPYPGSTKTTIDFSGTVTRFSIFYQF